MSNVVSSNRSGSRRATRRPRSAADFAERLQGRGRYGFSLRELAEATGLSHAAAGAQLKRLLPRIVPLYQKAGYYLIVPPEHRAAGAPPVTWWIDDFFAHQNEPYYLALLSAAAHWGASHQAAQITQVMTSSPRAAITLGRLKIVFLRKRALTATPQLTVTGGQAPFQVSTPEATALDLVRYMKQSGGISRVVQIIADLAPQMKVPAFKGALEAQPEITVIQRAGFILDALGRTPLARCAAEALAGHRLHSIALAGGTAPDAPLDERWSVYGRLPARADS